MTNPGMMDLEDYERDEVAAAAAAEAAKNPKPITGTEIPVELQGKTPEEQARIYSAVADGFKKSEEERKRLQEALGAAASSRIVETKVEAPTEIPELTDAELKTLHDEDPVSALRKVAERTEQRITKKLHEERIAPLTMQVTSLAQTQEMLAKDRHKETFELYGAEIEAQKKQLRPEALMNPAVWDDLIRYVRGGHTDELIERDRQKRTAGIKEGEKSLAGHSAAPTPKSSDSMRTHVAPLDDLEKEVMAKMGVFKDEADFRRWSGGPRMEITEVPQ